MPIYYCQPPDIIARYDVRRICQFLSDTGIPADPDTLSGAPYNANCLSIIADCSNKVLMACRVANRYLKSDLDAIYNSRNNADPQQDRSESLIRLVVDLSYGYILGRRALSMEQIKLQAPGFGDALDMLTLLKRGDAVFDDSVPDGTDAPSAGSDVEDVALGQTGSSKQVPCRPITWTQQTDGRIFPCG